MIRLTWQGHACFRIESGGTSVVTDPYTPEVTRLARITQPAQVVIRSSPTDRYHSCEAMVPGSHELIEALDVARSGPITVCGVDIEAFGVRERARGGKHLPGNNAMYRMVVGGLRILHLGDLGHALPVDYIERLRDQVDVMLAPTGDILTIAIADLRADIDAIRPRVVIPMHYQIRGLWLPPGMWIYPVEAFTSGFAETEVVWSQGADLELSRETLPASLTVYVLDAFGATAPSRTPSASQAAT